MLEFLQPGFEKAPFGSNYQERWPGGICRHKMPGVRVIRPGFVVNIELQV